MVVKELEMELYKGLLAWYTFRKGSTILCIGVNDSILQMLKENGHDVHIMEYRDVSENVSIRRYENTFEYIVAIKVIENVQKPQELLSNLRIMLTVGGKLLLGTDNRLGLRYFCGDKETFTGTYFNGVEGYSNFDCCDVVSVGGRCYAMNEIRDFINESGFDFFRFYSVLPNLDIPQLIYAEDYLPIESLATRYMPIYHDNSKIFLREKNIFDSLVKNNSFHQMANTYLIECSNSDLDTSVQHVTLSLDRGPLKAKATIIKKDHVEKKALYNEGKVGLKQLKENDEYLRSRGIAVVESELEEDTYRMPYIDAPIASVYLQELMTQDVNLFIQRMDEFRELLLRSSDIVEINEFGAILEKGFIDLIPLNCFWNDNEYLVYDQEFYLKRIPVNVMLWRTLVVIYNNNPTRESILSRNYFIDRYNMRDGLKEYQRIATQFIKDLRNQEELSVYNHMYRDTIKNIEDNRKAFEKESEIVIKQQEEKVQMNEDGISSSSGEFLIKAESLYNEYRENCFKDMDGKKIYVFGAGRFADKFLAFYKSDFNVVKIIDNNKDVWGTSMYGVPIESPDCLKEEKESYKVIICVKQYESILCQLKEMEVENIGIYDAHYVYPGRQNIVMQPEICVPKKYHVGYVSGVFDLFHIGHINMFKRAKEQCDYLIVAVTSDEYVRERKKREPFIPFDERLEVIRSCKYVDEAVGVPFKYAGTVEAFQKYHFDCQFCGNDYQNDPWWLKQKEYLQSHGSDLVFFPYTEQTSSTKIKTLIEQKLL